MEYLTFVQLDEHHREFILDLFENYQIVAERYLNKDLLYKDIKDHLISDLKSLYDMNFFEFFCHSEYYQDFELSEMLIALDKKHYGEIMYAPDISSCEHEYDVYKKWLKLIMRKYFDEQITCLIISFLPSSIYDLQNQP